MPSDAAIELGRFARELQWSSLTNEIRERARVTVRDVVACAVSGATVPYVASTVALLEDRAGRGVSGTLGTSARSSAGTAAFGIALAAAAEELDETHFLMRQHPAIHVVPVAIAVGEHVGATVGETLTAVVAGYEIGSRIGRAVTPRRGIHAHGSFGLAGGAAAAALLYGAESSGVAASIDLAASMTSASASAARGEGAEVYHAYFAAACERAVSLGALARSGVHGSPSALQNVLGGVLGVAIDLESLTQGLGDSFSVGTNFIKTYPVCADLHATVAAVENALDGRRLVASSVRSISVSTFDSACEVDEVHPSSSLLARFSLPWVVASLIVHGRLDEASFSAKALADGRVRSLAARVSGEVDDIASSAFPGRLQAAVEIVTDATVTPGPEVVLRGAVDVPSSTALWPGESERIAAKARALMAPSIGGSTQTVFDILHDDRAPIAALVEACAPSDSTTFPTDLSRMRHS